MLRVVLPVTAIDPVTRSIDIVSVVVTYEVVVSVDIYVVASPTAAPAPTSTPSRSDRDAGAVPYGCTTVISSVKGRIWVDHCSPNEGRVVRRHVDHFRTGLLNHHVGFAFDLFCFDLHLLIGLQLPSVLRFRAHALHRVHDVSLLGQKGVAQVCGPLDVFR